MNRVLSMLSRLRSHRWWRVLAVAMLLPVVVFSNPLAASAATSGTMTFSLEASGLETGIPGIGNTTCQLPWSVNAGGLVIGSSSRCDGGPDYSPGHCQPFEGACGSYGLVVKDSTGATMGSASFDPFDIGGGVGSVKAGLGAGYVALGSGVAAEACLSYYFVPAVGGATDVASCVPISVEQPTPEPGPGDACAAGVPHVKHRWVDISAATYWESTLDFTRTGAPASTAQWGYAILYHDGEVRHGDWTSSNQAKVRVVGFGGGPPPKPIGIQLYAYIPGGWNSPVSDARAASGNATLPTSPQHGYQGWTQPEHCRFWFGNQVRTDSATTADTPFGSIDSEPPAPAPDPVPPVIVAPVDDTPDSDSGMWSAILAVLRAIAGAIGELLTAVKNLVTALLNGLKGLFVPSDGFMESKWAGVDQKWQGTSPGRYMSALDDFSPGTVSGCAGLPLDVELGHGIAIHEHIGGACSGPMASAAAVTRVVITAVFAIAGAVACVRAVGAGLGWDPGIGRGGAA